MRTTFLAILGGYFLAILDAAVLPTLPGALSLAKVTIFFLVYLIVRFRFKEAVVAAFSAGLVWDILGVGLFGVNLISLILTTEAMIFLFTYQLSEQSWLALIGLHLLALIIFVTIWSILTLIGTNLLGSNFSLVWGSRFLNLILVLLGQMILIFGFRVTLKVVRHIFKLA